MAEIAFLNAVRDYLAGPAGLTPALGTSGFAEPATGDVLPVATAALSTSARVDIGLGGGLTEISTGSLQVISTIDLANPVLPGPDSFVLLDGARTELTLPHGGLIRADAVVTDIGPADLTVTVDGAPRVLVAAAPGPTEFTADAQTGVLIFGAALPATGSLIATYHVGIWERSTVLITGTLDIGIWDTDVTRLISVSGQAVRALMAATAGGTGTPLPGLQKIALQDLGAVTAPQAAAPLARERRARFAFEYEHVVDAPVSSGGIIARVPITSNLAAFSTDPNTGALVESIATETEE